MTNQGLSSAANKIASYGRGPDTGLAHMSPEEMDVIDYLQGGRRTNPHTGLPEYGLFGNIMKALVRVGASVGGFMVGGPAGAAAGSGLATKLTGGSWNDALKGAALSGIGAELGQGLTGGGWNPLGEGTAGGLTSAAPTVATGAAAGSAVPATVSLPGTVAPATGLAAFGNAATSTPGMIAGLGALSTPLNQPQKFDAPEPPSDNFRLSAPQPLARNTMPYVGDLTKYGQLGGEHHFFDDVNPQPRMLADGGPVGNFGPNAQQLRAAYQGYTLPLKTGGAVYGAGDGKSDEIDAKLSVGEHVIDAQTVSMAGNGDNDAGHRMIEKFKVQIRKRAGQKNPKKPTKPVGTLGSLLKAAA